MSWIAAGDNIINLDLVTNIGINHPNEKELFCSYNDRTVTTFEYPTETEARDAFRRIISYLEVRFDADGTITSGREVNQFGTLANMKEDEFGLGN